MFQFVRGPRTARAGGAQRPSLVQLLCLAALGVAALCPPLSAQDSKDKTIEQLLKELAAERAAREALEKRVEQLEAGKGVSNDELERRLQGLVAPGELQQQPPRPPSSPAFYDPAIGVFMDSVADAGNFDQRLGEDTDNFRLREAEVDMRLPLSPFAEGVAIFSWENAGNNEFEATVEEGYANINIGEMTDTNVDTTAKLGRFRPIFGRNNQLHLHDWLQVYQPLPVRDLLGPEGLVGEGVMLHQPIVDWEGEGGLGRTVNLDLSVVNGELFVGDTALGESAADAGLGLQSDDTMVVARVSQFSELDTLSDIEFGLSAIEPLGGNAVTTDSGERVDVHYYDADITWRSRSAEHGVGSWLVQAEGMRAQVDDNAAGFVPDTQNQGWWLTVQRQTSPNWYVGVLYGTSDLLNSTAQQDSIAPYVTWYADEFFRVRGEIEHLTQSGGGANDNISDANRLLLEFTWNFGVHAPHPYWVNK